MRLGGLRLKDIWVSLSGALAQQQNVDTIANNVANANTPGFKKDQLVFKEHLTALDSGVEGTDMSGKEWKPSDFYHSHGAEKGFVKVDGSYTDFTQGQLRPTQNPLDLALSGKGFFEVLTPNGVRYTRRGTFTIAKDGSLVTNTGFPVLAKSQNENVPPTTRKINIGSSGQVSVTFNGDIYQKGEKIGELSVVEFNDPNALRKEGTSLFINQNEENQMQLADQTAVRQGFVEESNVNALSEMSSLIKATRNFESIQRAMKAYDSIAQKGVNEIAKF